MYYCNKWKDFIFEPRKAFDNAKKESSDIAFKYLVVWSIIMSVIISIITYIVFSIFTALAPLIPGIPVEFMGLFGLFSGAFSVGMFFISLVFGIVGSVVWALWLHLWAYLLGAQKGVDQTFKSVFYGQSPSYVLLWIPFINIIVFLWSFVLMGMGLKRLHGITGGKAAAAIIVALAIPIIIAVAIFLPIAAISSMPYQSIMTSWPN